MASTNKTPQLGLNQWAAGDEVKRTDFNGDNAKLDAAVGALQMTNPVTGSFVGDGTNNRKISLGFRPSLVIFQGITSGTGFVAVMTAQMRTLFTDFKPYGIRQYPASMNVDFGVKITDDGIQTTDFSYFNQLNEIQGYIAFR